jgi:hypothetical protein
MSHTCHAPLLRYAAVALTAAMAITGCSESPGPEQAAQPAPAVTETAPNVPGMTEALTQPQVGAEYSIVAAPVLAQDGTVVRTVIGVKNAGTVAINSNGKFPVNLAVSLVDDTGTMVSKDFVRVGLPAEGIAAGASAEVVADVLAKEVLGKTLRFGLVQEGVAWYTDFNVAPLDYGPLTTCEDHGKQTVCGKDGKPLTAAATN